ncbi:MAG: hypothetical protein C4576_15465 [Desulfobacteraceae bacterium]|nr:MAG: hypothetical protein C4576_15465 [Desulfobacteraceae bacterium]
MVGCPDKDTLEKFVDHGLNEEMNEQIFSHLVTCGRCLERISLLMAEERGLIRSLSKAGGAVENRAVSATAAGCFSKAALLSYVGDCLDEEQTRRVESHLHECDRCLVETMAIQKRLAATADLEVLGPGSETRKVKPDSPAKEILEIILRAAGNMIETIRHNGELLSLGPALGATRGAGDIERRAIGVRKDFTDRDLSIEVKMSGEGEGPNFDLIVSLMRISKEEFLEGIDIELINESTSSRSTTDRSGVARFKGIGFGSYGLVVDRELTVRITFE